LILVNVKSLTSQALRFGLVGDSVRSAVGSIFNDVVLVNWKNVLLDLCKFWFNF